MRKKISLLAVFVIITMFSFGQAPKNWTVGEIINRVPAEPIPFDGEKGLRFDSNYSYYVNNDDNLIPDRLYDNVQLSEYTHASESSDLMANAFRKFTGQNGNTLLVVSFGGVTDYRTDVMCVINSSGQILSTLEVAVVYARAFFKQFRINGQGQIIVTTIKPTSTTSIPFVKFDNFQGYREDITYSINSKGQFVQILKKTFQPKNYTETYLSDRKYNLWNGADVPVN